MAAYEKANQEKIAHYRLDKNKYLKILKTENLGAALTHLHHDLRELEFECFEGPRGYNPELYQLMKDYREYSVELWDMRYKTEAVYNQEA